MFVIDNQRYGTIRMWQDRRGTGQGVATDLGAIDFAAVARACGARGATVERQNRPSALRMRRLDAEGDSCPKTEREARRSSA